jgi:threonine aldolase
MTIQTAHTAGVLERVLRENLNPTPGYGEDEYGEAARALIRRGNRTGGRAGAVHSRRTQTNQLMIAHALRPHEAVIAAQTGHIQTSTRRAPSRPPGTRCWPRPPGKAS